MFVGQTFLEAAKATWQMGMDADDLVSILCINSNQLPMGQCS